MGDTIKITKIEVTNKEGKGTELTLDEARDLYHQLHELFGKTNVTFVVNPLYPYRHPYWHTWNGNGITYTANSGLSVTYQGK